MTPSRPIQFFVSLATVVLIFYVLYVAKDLLIPFVVAIVIWYLIISIAGALRKIPLGKRRLPNWIAYSGAMALIALFAAFIVNLIMDNIFSVIGSLPVYQNKLATLLDNTFTLLHVKDPPNLGDLFKNFDLVSLASNLAQTVTMIAGNTGVIVIYVLFLLLEHSTFDQKLDALIPNTQKHSKAKKIIRDISSQIQAYVRIKTLLSIVTAFISYLVLKGVGVDFAEFWSLLIFLLNFIPTVGSIIATILPCLLTIVQFESWYPFIIVTTSLTTLQFTMGNILEPRIIGRSVNLSGLVIILSLAIWGWIWGIVGMFLCVPIMVIANIIMSNFTQTKPIAIILSGPVSPTEKDT